MEKRHEMNIQLKLKNRMPKIIYIRHYTFPAFQSLKLRESSETLRSLTFAVEV